MSAKRLATTIAAALAFLAGGAAHSAPPAKPRGPTAAEFAALRQKVEEQNELIMRLTQLEGQHYEFLLKLLQNTRPGSALAGERRRRLQPHLHLEHRHARRGVRAHVGRVAARPCEMRRSRRARRGRLPARVDCGRSLTTCHPSETARRQWGCRPRRGRASLPRSPLRAWIDSLGLSSGVVRGVEHLIESLGMLREFVQGS